MSGLPCAGFPRPRPVLGLTVHRQHNFLVDFQSGLDVPAPSLGVQELEALGEVTRHL